MATNPNKGKSHQEAWRRIAIATTEGYYFEVVAICESIISDRLLSYVLGVDQTCKFKETTNFGSLIDKWRDLSSGILPPHGSVDLGEAVDTWRKERNSVIHGLAKSLPGTPTEPVPAFINKAKSTAEDGVKLAKAVKKWHEAQLKVHRQRIAAATQAANP